MLMTHRYKITSVIKFDGFTMHNSDSTRGSSSGSWVRGGGGGGGREGGGGGGGGAG